MVYTKSRVATSTGQIAIRLSSAEAVSPFPFDERLSFLKIKLKMTMAHLKHFSLHGRGICFRQRTFTTRLEAYAESITKWSRHLTASAIPFALVACGQSWRASALTTM